MIQALFRFTAPEDKRKEILDVLQCLKGPAEAARGCRTCRILRDAADDSVFTYLVLWNTKQEIEEHFRSERFRRLLPYIEMSVEPPEVEISFVDQICGVEFLVACLDGEHISEDELLARRRII